VRVGAILELGDFYTGYRESKRAAVAAATAALQQRISDVLGPLSELGTPLEG
jgi:hypothetical protein